jgi:hypothetical protein
MGMAVKQIEHDQQEFTRKRERPFSWWIPAIVLALVWFGYLYHRSPDWWSIWLGIGTGALIAAWGMDMDLEAKKKSARHFPTDR